MNPQIEKILKLPTKQKIAILVAVLLVEAAALVYFLYLPKHKALTDLRQKHTELQAEVQKKTQIANNLPKIQREYEQLQQELAKALTELPNSREIPSLLTGITATGKNAGLDFLVFKPRPEFKKDFYAEVPVDITIAGSYFSVANFFAAVANLPRIVNITNVDFAEVKNVNNRMMTKVNCLATTFRFLGKEEITDDKKPKKK
ncbi:MAG: pilus assembly protein PilO [Geobacter sp.]|nr:pilus assembly protein PilO [Geobacter sp.]